MISISRNSNLSGSTLSERVRSIKPSETLAITAKAKELKASGIPVLSFAAGEPDFDTPDRIKDAAIRALQSGATKYTPAQGTVALREAIAKKFKDDNNLEYGLNEIVVSCGAKHSVFNVIQALVDPDDEVIIPAPYWVSYPEMVAVAGGKSVIVSTMQEDGFRMTPKQLEASITHRSKLLILNSPSNPTGSVYSEQELRAMAEVIKKHKLHVLSDEIYEHLIYDGNKHFSIASIDQEMKDLTITVNGHSKAYSMTGWRLGYLGASKEIASAITSLQSHSTSNPTSFVQDGGVEALLHCKEDIVQFKEVFEQRRNLIFAELSKETKLAPFHAQGAFYMFCDISKSGLDSTRFCEELLAKKYVAAVPGLAFGSDQHIRLSFAASDENILEGCRRIHEFLR